MFSSLTVAAAFAALLVFPQSFLYSMGVAGIAVALLAAIGGLIVLPALLVVLGERVNALAPERSSARAGRSTFPTARAPGTASRAGSCATRPRSRSRPHWCCWCSHTLDGVKSAADDASILPPEQSSKRVDAILANQFPPGELDTIVSSSATRRGALDDYAAELAPFRGWPGSRGRGRSGLREPDRGRQRAQPLQRGRRAVVATCGRSTPPCPCESGVTPPTRGRQRDGQAPDRCRAPRYDDAAPAAGDDRVAGPAREGAHHERPLALGGAGHVSGSSRAGTSTASSTSGPTESRSGSWCWSSSPAGSRPTTGLHLAHARGAPLRADNEESVALGLERTGRIVTSAALLFAVAMEAISATHRRAGDRAGSGDGRAIDASLVRMFLVPALWPCWAIATGGAPRS